LIAAAGVVVLTTIYGRKWRESMDEKKADRLAADEEKQGGAHAHEERDAVEVAVEEEENEGKGKCADEKM
jgi:membrane protein implicated in regulation of membrane protease activity